MSHLTTGRLPDAELDANFAERKAPMSDDQALAEASRCLYCYDAPCMIACPTSIDIPSFIQRIGSGDVIGSANRILEANVLGASCARVCAVEELCEQACVLQAHERPIEIGRLQRYATDALIVDGRGIPYSPGPATGRSVGIVGGGPAGLAAAANLRAYGHDVTIYDRQPELGGLSMYGIIPLREPTEIARWEVDQVLALGVEARTGVHVGVDISGDELLEAHDAVFLAIGSGARVQQIGLEGGDVPGVEDALEFIERIRVERPGNVPVGRRVIVVGAGNTAMDACTIAARLGADSVTCVYRRTELEMTGYPDEYDHCLRDGVRFQWLTQPLFTELGPDGHVSALVCGVVQLGDPGPDGRRTPTVSDERVTIPADHVLLATGQQRQTHLIDQLGLARDGQRPMTGLFATSNPRVFAGGDATLTGKELSVVDAVAGGRDAAHAIHAALSSGDLMTASAGASTHG